MASFFCQYSKKQTSNIQEVSLSTSSYTSDSANFFGTSALPVCLYTLIVYPMIITSEQKNKGYPICKTVRKQNMPTSLMQLNYFPLNTMLFF